VTTTTIQNPETDTAKLVAQLIADSVTGLHYINSKFVRADAIITKGARGVITLTIQQVEFDADDKAVQVVVQLTPPTVITPTPPPAAPSVLDNPAATTPDTSQNGDHPPPAPEATAPEPREAGAA